MKKPIFLLVTLLQAPLAAMEDSYQAHIKQMTLEQKIAQCFMVAVVPNEASNQKFMARSPYSMGHAHVENLIQKHQIGGVIFLGRGTSQQVRSCIDRFQGASRIPLLIALDAEWGLTMRLHDCLRLPKAMTLGALPKEKKSLIRQLAQYIGCSCKELGIGLNLAPVADVNNNPLNPIIGIRSFGEDPEHVAQCAQLYAQGLKDAGVLACAKHFPGHGDTALDSHKTLPTIAHDASHLEQIELHPFCALIEKEIPAIMSAHLCVQALDYQNPASMSKKIVTDFLQKKLHFEGLIITDGLGMGALGTSSNPGEIELEGFLAGNDILLGARHIPEAITLIKQAVQKNKISIEEIDQKVEKIMRAKSAVAHPTKTSCKHLVAENIKKEIFMRAITLVKNDKQLLPLKADIGIEVIPNGTSTSPKFEETLKKHMDQTKKLCSPVILLMYPQRKEHMIDETKKESAATSPLCITQQIADYQKKNKTVIAVLCDSAYRIADVKDADAILCAYEDDPDAQFYAALTVLGLYNPTGILPVSVSQFSQGTSLSYT